MPFEKSGRFELRQRSERDRASRSVDLKNYQCMPNEEVHQPPPTGTVRTGSLATCSDATYQVDTSNCYTLTMLEFAILGLLKERSMHGYDLRRHLRDDFGVLANLSFGSLYPALSRLETSGAIRSIGAGAAAEIDNNAPVLLTGSLGGERAATVARRATAKVAETLGRSGTRARKVYEITPMGELVFEQLLESPSTSEGDLRGFSLRLAFARYLSPQARIRLLERRRIELSDRLRRSSAHLDHPKRVLDLYERSLAEHARDAVANDLSWIERLLAREHEQTAATTSGPRDAIHRNEGPTPISSTTSHVNNEGSATAHLQEGANLSHDGGITA